MKLICEKETHIVKFVLADESAIDIYDDRIEVYGPHRFNVNDLNESNAYVTQTTVAQPDDWLGNKYVINKSSDENVADTWDANPDWIDPDSL